MADEPDSTIPPARVPDLLYVADELNALKRGLDGVAMAVEALEVARECNALGQLLHLVDRDLRALCA